jgi:hypothetical protein
MLLTAHLLATQDERLGKELHGKVEVLRRSAEGELRVKQQHQLVCAGLGSRADDPAT